MNKLKVIKRMLATLMVIVVAVTGLPAPAASSAPIGIDDAIQKLIEEIIQPETLDHDIVAYMLKEPLEAGDNVTPEVGGGGDNITEDTYFIFVDDDPLAFFAHEVRYVFIYAATGSYTVGHETWPPLINGKSIIELEALGQVELLRFYSTSAKPSPVTANLSAAPEGDYGDAPEGQVAYQWAPSVNSSVIGSFPTFFNTTNSTFPGDHGAHCLNIGQEMLGVSTSAEVDVTDPSDPDGVTNLVDADSDEWKFVEIDISTAPASARLMLDVTVTAMAENVTRYLNVLVDFDQDGRWKGSDSGKEWAVINYSVNVTPGTTQMITTPSFDWGKDDEVPSPVWMRVSLTRSQVDGSKFTPAVGGWDGSGQFQYGEIEDCIVFLPWSGPETKPRPTDPPIGDEPKPGELPKVAPCPTPVTNYAVIINGGDKPGDGFVKASFERMKRVLQEQGYKMKEFGPSAKPSDIGAYMAELGKKVICADRVFIYIVGHGKEDEGIQMKGSKQLISPADLKNWLSQIDPCDNEPCPTPKKSVCICVVVETCYAGMFLKEKQKECRIIVTSSKSTEKSYGDRRGLDVPAGGWFGRSWVEDLRNPKLADINKDKIVDCKEAFASANATTRAIAAKQGKSQSPDMSGNCCNCTCPCIKNETCYPRYYPGEQNPDGSYPVTIVDKMYSEACQIKKVEARVDDILEFEADDINQSQYEFSFAVNLGIGYHTLTIEAWDVADNYLKKEVNIVVPKVALVCVGGEVYPVNKLAMLVPWIALGVAIIAGTIIAMRRRSAQN